jgi:hypothetical protein
MITGLAGGIGFMYAVFEYKDMPPLLTIVAQHHPAPWAPEALNRLNVSVEEQHSGKAAAGVAKLRKAGRPALVSVDRSRLPWHGLEPGYGNDPYVVAVAGIDSDTVYVDDSGFYELSIEDFSAAWSAHKKGRHHALIVGEAGPVDLPTAVRSALKMTAEHLTGPVLGNSFDVNFGFSGMEKLAAQLRDTKKGWAKRFGEPLAFAHGMRRMYECLELEYTSPGATRPVYADFLDEAGYDGALFRESGAKWSRLASLALDAISTLPYAELVEERMALTFSRGRDAEPEIRSLNKQIDAVAASYQDPLGDDGRRELFSAMADIVDECVALEREAIALF